MYAVQWLERAQVFDVLSSERGACSKRSVWSPEERGLGVQAVAHAHAVMVTKIMTRQRCCAASTIPSQLMSSKR